MKLKYLKPTALKALAKARGKRVSKEFLQALDAHVETKIVLACQEHNGGRKTLDLALAHYFLGSK